MPEMQPSFSLQPGDEVFTMGSCFARNIEAHLLRLGCKIPTCEFVLPASEIRQNVSGPARGLTLFTTPVFRQIIEWTEGVMQRGGRVTREDCEPYAFHLPDGSVIDLGLSNVTPVSTARFVERRQELFDLYLRAFEAKCVVMTPGLIEAWFDSRSARYIHITPIRDGRSLDDTRFEFELVTFQHCFDDLDAVIRIIRRYNPDAKFIITVSPVPLIATFTGMDIIVANIQSKATLRAACAEICARHEFVDYFPSYEAVSLSRRRVWEKDMRHVTDSFVAKIVESMAAHYFSPGMPGRVPRYYRNFLDRTISLFRSRSIDPIVR